MDATQPLLFQGTLLNQQGRPVEGARIQMWQTDLDGNYLHSLPSARPVAPQLDEHASIVSDFQYFGSDTTDGTGNFDFLTYRPGIYPARPYSHFHVMVWLTGEDATPALVTQFYFSDESPPFPEELHLDITAVDESIYGFGGCADDDNNGNNGSISNNNCNLNDCGYINGACCNRWCNYETRQPH